MYGGYGARGGGAMLGGGGYSGGYEGSSKRQRMMEPDPYFAVSSGHLYGGYGGGSNLPSEFPVVRLRGLPFNCSDVDIIKFFAGLDIVDILLVNKNGRFSGEAFVVVATQMQVQYALRRDRQNMGRRYIEVFRCRKDEYYNAVAAEVREGTYDIDPESPPHPRAKKSNKKSPEKMDMEYTEVLRLRGLPFSVSKSDIIEFFENYKLAEDKVQIACRPDGKTTGEAFVEFVSADVAKRAMCKDKMMIGSRYVELFPSTSDEARRAMSRSRH